MIRNAFKAGEHLVCVYVGEARKLTLGTAYRVHWNLREDVNFPTVINDDGRPTQYSGRHFVRITAIPDMLAALVEMGQFFDAVEAQYDVCEHTRSLIDAVRGSVAEAKGVPMGMKGVFAEIDSVLAEEAATFEPEAVASPELVDLAANENRYILQSSLQ